MAALAATLRPTQQRVPDYPTDRPTVSAVPGSGKTLVPAHLAARLIADGRIDTPAGRQVLLVTYLNGSVDTVGVGVAELLHESHRAIRSCDERTLHSLPREILPTPPAAAGIAEGCPVLEERQASRFISQAVDGCIRENPDAWRSFVPASSGDPVPLQAPWRRTTEKAAGDHIRVAKNHRLAPDDGQERLRHRLGVHFHEVGRDHNSAASAPGRASASRARTALRRRRPNRGAAHFWTYFWESMAVARRPSSQGACWISTTWCGGRPICWTRARSRCKCCVGAGRLYWRMRHRTAFRSDLTCWKRWRARPGTGSEWATPTRR